jgi:hypothetical protein
MYSEFRNWVSYDSESGLITWVKSPSANCVVGTQVGGMDKDGYAYFHLHKKRWPIHRMAWVLTQGPIPDGYEIDHIDGNRANNKLTNLRLVTRSENNQNRKKARKDSATGLIGVTLHKRSGLFNSRIKLDGKTKSLGYFVKPEDAHRAYLECKRINHIANTL